MSRGNRRSSSPVRAVTKWLGTDAAQPLEPEGADLGQYRALPRDRLAHDDIERAHPIAGHQQQMVRVRLVHFADLALAVQGQRQLALGEDGHVAAAPARHTVTSARSTRAARGVARAISGFRYSSRNSPTCSADRPV